MKDAASLQLYGQGDRPGPLRVGLLLRSGCALGESDGGLLSTLLSCSFIRIVQVITVPVPERPGLRKFFEPAHWLLESYRTIDSSVLARAPSRAACQSDDALVTLEDPGRPVGGPPDLDALVCLGMVGPVRDYCRLARTGVWWVGPVDLPDQDRSTSHLLQSLADADAPHTEAVWSWGPMDPEPRQRIVAAVRPISRLSLEKNDRVMTAVRPGMLLAALWQLEARGPRAAPALQAAQIAHGPDPLLRKQEATPDSPVAVASAITRLAFRHARHRVRRAAKPDLWNIGLRVHAEGRPHDDPHGYQWLSLPHGNWQADPFLFQRSGRTWLFYEAIDDLAAPAVIACAEIDSTGAIGPSQVVLQRPYHLSYPQVFADAGEIWMIPETGTNGTVELYRAVEFPYRWELVRVLHQGPWFDTTVAVHNGRYWFFSSLQQDSAYLTSQLVLFSARQLDGDWIMHPRGPVSFDARYARGAGGIFESNGVKVRPAQDGSRTYGGNIHFMCIEAWDEFEYRESPAGFLGPGQIEGASGVHTYNRTGHFEVIDRKMA